MYLKNVTKFIKKLNNGTLLRYSFLPHYFFTERNAAPIHDDASHDLKSCFDKYGISHESLAYCLHITTTAMSKTKRSPEKDYLSNLLRNLMNKNES